ncbi:MAG: prolipoprotein diacylglyceryl transferase [Lachnospiraceae bacterium]|nr:prolipoprotein diacylglyceryl transferase [Lachnospiraceae bacterium]
MRNELFSIGPATVTGYGLMIAIGILVCFFIADRRAKKYGLDPDVIFNVGYLSIIGGFISSKLFYIAMDLPNIIRNGLFWQSLISHGFIVYGGLIGGVFTAVAYLWIKKIPFLPYFDLAVPSMAVAQAIGRLGCLFAGCCYGRMTDSRFGIIFSGSSMAPNGIRLIPTQIISSLGNFAIMFALLWYAKRKPKTGRVGALYIILYAVGRFLVEYLRNDYRGSVGPLSVSQLISIIVLVPGVWLFIRAKNEEASKPAKDTD